MIDAFLSIYNEKIMDHYKNPRNRGDMENPTVKVDAVNPVCGDCTNIQLKIEDDIISDVKFESLGCAISIASASMLTEEVKGKKIEEAKKIQEKDILDMLGTTLSSYKQTCATMSVDALQRAISSYEKTKEDRRDE